LFVIPPVSAQNENRASAIGSAVTPMEVSQNGADMTDRTTTANPDISIPGKVDLPRTFPAATEIPPMNSGVGGK
jgi:hypothetical protein